MKDIFAQFREQSEMIRVAPHRRAWDRVESKLSAHQSRRKLLGSRVFSFAAVLLFLIAISAGILVYTQSWYQVDSMQYSLSLEELKSVSTTAESIYDVERIHVYYTVFEER
jgi:hypothetical protein